MVAVIFFPLRGNTHNNAAVAIAEKPRQQVYAVLGPYNSSPLKGNRCLAQNQCLNQRPQVLRGICSLGRA